MFRLFHTADWHLGQTFHGYDRDHEHAVFFEWLLRMLQDRKPDALIVAGDVFDSVNPSAAAQRRLYDFLARAHQALPKLQIIITAGNHDAASRLEAPAGLLERLNITVVGTVVRDSENMHVHDKFLVPLKDPEGHVRVLVIAVPFLRPSDVPNIPDVSDAYLQGVRELYRGAIQSAQILRDRDFPEAALVAIGHCHMQDCTESRDSERRLIIGGAEALRTDTFPPILSYVALGHLHKPQDLDGGRIHYSGSPIPLSFSEKDYDHRILEVTFGDDGQTSVTPLPIPKTASLLRLPIDAAAPLAKVLQVIEEYAFDASLPSESFPFLEIRVLDDGPDPTRRRQIEKALEGKPVRLAAIKLEGLQGRGDVTSDGPDDAALANLSDLDPESIMITAHRDRYGTEPDPLLLGALQEILSAENLSEPPTA